MHNGTAKFLFTFSTFLNTRNPQSYEKVMFEVKAVPVHTMKAHRGSRGIVPFIFSHGTIWRRVVNFTPRPLYPRYPLNRRLV